MNYLKDKKKIIKLSVFFCVFFIAALVEALIFNFSYFATENKGKEIVSTDSLVLNDLVVDGNVFKITGEEPYFYINEDKHIEYLEIDINKQTQGFAIYSDPTKKNIADSIYKDSLWIRVKDDALNLKFKIEVDEGIEEILIDGIRIDNTFVFNWLRYYIILSVLIVVSFFILYRDIAKEKLHVTFLLLILTFGIAISVATPTYFAYDETDHFIKAYQTASGDLGFSGNKEISWIDDMDNFRDFDGKTSPYQSYMERIKYFEKFGDKEYNNKRFYESTAQTYLFLPYIPAATGIVLGKALNLPFSYIYYLGRVFTLLAYGIIGFFVIKHIKIAKRLIFIISLLPATVFVAGSYSADPMTVMFTIAAVAIFINMLAAEKESIGWKFIMFFGIVMSMSIMSKISYAPLGLLIFAVPNDKFSKEKVKNPWIAKFTVLVIIAVAAFGTLLFGNLHGINQWNKPGVDVSGQVGFIMNNIITYIITVVNFIMNSITLYIEGPTNLFAHLPSLQSIWYMIALVTLFIVAIIDNEDEILEIRGRDRLALFLSVGMSWGLVITALYVSFTAVGSPNIEGVQGRYFTPLLLPTMLMFKNKLVKTTIKKQTMNYKISILMAVMLAYPMFRILSWFSM